MPAGSPGAMQKAAVARHGLPDLVRGRLESAQQDAGFDGETGRLRALEPAGAVLEIVVG
jgi:hypothetical protein